MAEKLVRDNKGTHWIWDDETGDLREANMAEMAGKSGTMVPKQPKVETQGALLPNAVVNFLPKLKKQIQQTPDYLYTANPLTKAVGSMLADAGQDYVRLADNPYTELKDNPITSALNLLPLASRVKSTYQFSNPFVKAVLNHYGDKIGPEMEPMFNFAKKELGYIPSIGEATGNRSALAKEALAAGAEERTAKIKQGIQDWFGRQMEANRLPGNITQNITPAMSPNAAGRKILAHARKNINEVGPLYGDPGKTAYVRGITGEPPVAEETKGLAKLAGARDVSGEMQGRGLKPAKGFAENDAIAENIFNDAIKDRESFDRLIKDMSAGDPERYPESYRIARQALYHKWSQAGNEKEFAKFYNDHKGAFDAAFQNDSAGKAAANQFVRNMEGRGKIYDPEQMAFQFKKGTKDALIDLTGYALGAAGEGNLNLGQLAGGFVGRKALRNASLHFDKSYIGTILQNPDARWILNRISTLPKGSKNLKSATMKLVKIAGQIGIPMSIVVNGETYEMPAEGQ